MFSDIKIPDDVRDTFELIALHFTHVFWNELYSVAKDKFNDGANSMTETYKIAMKGYHKHMTLRKIEWFQNSLSHIRHKFNEHGKMTFTVDDCAQSIADAFIPVDYKNSIKKSDKQNIACTALMNSVGQLIHVIMRERMSMIIENHIQANMIVLKEDIVRIYILQREEFHSKFIDGDISETRVHTDVVTAKRIMSNVEEVKKINDKLTQELNELRTINDRYKAEIVSRDSTIRDLISTKVQLQADVNRYKKNIYQLIQKIKKLQVDTMQISKYPEIYNEPKSPPNSPSYSARHISESEEPEISVKKSDQQNKKSNFRPSRFEEPNLQLGETDFESRISRFEEPTSRFEEPTSRFEEPKSRFEEPAEQVENTYEPEIEFDSESKKYEELSNTIGRKSRLVDFMANDDDF